MGETSFGLNLVEKKKNCTMAPTRASVAPWEIDFLPPTSRLSWQRTEITAEHRTGSTFITELERHIRTSAAAFQLREAASEPLQRLFHMLTSDVFLFFF